MFRWFKLHFMISGWWQGSVPPEDQLKSFIIRVDCLPANISGVHKIQFVKKCTMTFYLVYWVTLPRVCEGHCYLNLLIVLDSQSSGPWFEFPSGHYLDLFLGSPSSDLRPLLHIANWLVSGQLRFSIMLCLIWNICFINLFGPTGTCAINTAEGK